MTTNQDNMLGVWRMGIVDAICRIDRVRLDSDNLESTIALVHAANHLELELSLFAKSKEEGGYRQCHSTNSTTPSTA